MSDETPTEEIALTSEQSPGRLLELAVKQDLDVEKLERLMDLEERWRAQRAKEAFFSALAKFQAAVPSITRDSEVSFSGTHYNFASLPVIKETIQPALTECGLTFRWELLNAPDHLATDCIITHVDGHSERTRVGGPPDNSGSKNAVQARGSTITYLQRYSLIAALGLTTADQDDDGRQGISPQEEYTNLPTVKTEAAPRFDRDAKLDFGKHRDITWREVEAGYLKWLINKGGGDRAVYAEMEMKARKDTQPVPELKLFLNQMTPKQVKSLLYDRYAKDGIGELGIEAQNDLLLWLQAEGPVRDLWKKVGEPANDEILGAKFPGKPYRMLDPKDMESLEKILTDYIKDPNELRF